MDLRGYDLIPPPPPPVLSNISQNGVHSAMARQSVTLRRTAAPDPTSSNELIQEFVRFWTGLADTITLPNVQIVPGAEAVARSGGNVPNISSREDLMDIDPNPAAHPPIIPTIGSISPLSFSGLAQFNSSAENQFFSTDPIDFDWSSPIPEPPSLLPTHALPNRLSNQPSFSEPPQPEPLIVHQRGIDHDSRALDAVTQYMVSRDPVPSPPDGSRNCRACFDTLPSPIFLTCGHIYCRPCLNQLVSAGIANKMSWPPKCCRGRQGMDVEAIQNHLDEDVLIRYVSVFEEYSTPNPIYCANRTCSRHIEQSRIERNPGKFVPCGQCATVTCIECKQDMMQHVGDDGTSCKKLEELMNEGDRKLAKSNRWKQCPGCKNLVERTEGCDHMACQCGTEFCYKCGAERDFSATGCVCDANARRHINRVRGIMRPSQRRAQAATSANNAPPAEAAGAGFRTLMSRPLLPSSLSRLDAPPPPPPPPPPPSNGRHVPEVSKRRKATMMLGQTNGQNVESASQPRPSFHPGNVSGQGGDVDVGTKPAPSVRPPRSVYPNSRPIFAPSGIITTAVPTPFDRTATRLVVPRNSTTPSSMPSTSPSLPRRHDAGQSMLMNAYASSPYSYLYSNTVPEPIMGYAPEDGSSRDNRRNKRSATNHANEPSFYSGRPF